MHAFFWSCHTAARDGHEKLADDIDQRLQRLQAMLTNWQTFEAGLQNYTKWFREQEAVFRSQVLQNTLPEKEQALENFVKQRQVVTTFEKEVTGFLDQSHTLLQTSNAERIKPLVMQISNRYQLLHVLSKEVKNITSYLLFRLWSMFILFLFRPGGE